MKIGGKLSGVNCLDTHVPYDHPSLDEDEAINMLFSDVKTCRSVITELQNFINARIVMFEQDNFAHSHLISL